MPEFTSRYQPRAAHHHATFHDDVDGPCPIDTILPEPRWHLMRQRLRRLPDAPVTERDRRVLAGILYATTTATPWEKLPHAFGGWRTAWNQYKRWQETHQWNAILEAFLSALPREQRSHWRRSLKVAARLRTTPHGRHPRPHLPLPASNDAPTAHAS